MPYLLDTNVISELRLVERGSPRVQAWRRSVAYEETYLSVLVLGEMRRGVEAKRRKDTATAHAFEKWLKEVEAVYRDRLLEVDREICEIWGRMPASGSVGTVDGLIAATALCHGLTIVTRNTRDFQKCGVDFINPFEA